MKYMARRLRTGQWLDRDLELTGVTRRRILSGPQTIQCTVPSTISQQVMSDGLRMMEDWGTVIYAVNDDTGRIEAHGIVQPPTEYGDVATSVLSGGVTSYPQGIVYTESRNWGPQPELPYSAAVYDGDTLIYPEQQAQPFIDRPDPVQIFRDLWAWVQAQPMANVGAVLVGSTSSNKRIGTYEEPYRIQWWDNTDVGGALTTLATEAPFDFVEMPVFIPQGAAPGPAVAAIFGDGFHPQPQPFDRGVQYDVAHVIVIGAPRLGRRRTERFAFDENIAQVIPVKTPEGYANDVIGVGNGDPGPNMAQARARWDDGRLWRPMVITDKTLGPAAISNYVNFTARQLRNRLDVDAVVLREHPNASLSSLDLGDEILVQGDHPQFGVFSKWVRIISIETADEKPGEATLSVAAVEKFTYDTTYSTPV